MARQIPPCGPKDAKIIIVGEAPGGTEEQLGRPFVGSAGSLLTDCLLSSGIQMNRCYLTNVIKERPENNNISKFISLDRKLVITPEYTAYENALYEEIRALPGNLVIAVGNIAMYALLRMRNITARRGSVFWSSAVEKKVLVSLHPAAALRQYIWKWLIIMDMKRAAIEGEYPEIRAMKREIVIVKTYSDALAWIEKLKQSERLSIDIEVTNNEVACIGLAPHAKLGVCFPFIQKGANLYDPEQETIIWTEIAKLLADESIPKEGQNLTFDFTFLFNRYGIIIRPIDDSMIGTKLYMPDMKAGLDFINSLYTDMPYYKDEGKKWSKFEDGEDMFWTYNVKDCLVVSEAMPQLLKRLKVQGNLETYNRQKALIEPLVFMQTRGMRYDKEGAERASAEAIIKIAELKEELNELCGKKLNSSSPKQLIEYFYRELGIPSITKMSTGKPTTDELALKKIARKGYPQATKILEIRKLEKLNGTYYQMACDSDNRLRSSFNPVGTKYGRLSSSENIFDTGGNFQNMPPDFRRFLLADEGYLLCVVDLAKADNTVVAYIAPEPNMIHAIENGIDLHRLTASLIFNKPMADISDEDDCKADPSRYSTIGGGIYDERFWGKKANHGLNYGLGYMRFALLYEISNSEAKFLRDSYLRAYPGIETYWRWVQNALQQNQRTLTNPFGRKIRFLDRWGYEMFKEAYAALPQSTVADKINEHGVCELYYNPQTYPHVELLNQVHDSVVFQIPLSLGAEAIASNLASLQESLSRPITWHSTTFSIGADIKVGFNFRDMVKVKMARKENIEKALLELKKHEPAQAA